jgi:4-hydroxyphenylpyruvate dioxygenase
MNQDLLNEQALDYIEIYVPLAKPLVYWHRKALGFSLVAQYDSEPGAPGLVSYCLTSGKVRLVITSTFPVGKSNADHEVGSFLSGNSCGVKRMAFHVQSVTDAFYSSIQSGARPVKFPEVIEDELGYIEEAAIKLFDNNEVVFINRSKYQGVFKPGFKAVQHASSKDEFFVAVDHVSSELRINETSLWTDYLSRSIGSRLIQKIENTEDNKTGMLLNISQVPGHELAFVMTEPATHDPSSRVQQSISKYGPSIHHLAFSTDDIISTIKHLAARDVDFVSFPDAYYDMLRQNEDLKGIDIDALQELGILIDKEDDKFLLQKFLKPMGDRPYFFYEIVQRVNGYSGFALGNIAALRKAEELQITKVASTVIPVK